MTHFAKRTVWVAVTALGVMTSSAGCSLNPSSLASSARGVGNGYDLTLVFDSALNLPDGSDVKLDGASVGSVRDVRLADSGVDVIVQIETGVKVQAEAVGSIRQTTILGDPYVSIETSGQGGSAYLSAGEVIPQERTTSAPPLEDTLAVLATFVNGGNVQKIEDVVREVNTILPEVHDLQRIADVSAGDLENLSRNTTELDRMLAGITDTAVAIEPRLPEIDAMFSPAGMHYWSKMSNILGNIGVVLPSIGSVFEGGYWLVPMLDSVNSAVQVFGGGADGAIPTAEHLNQFLSETIFPFIQRPGFNIVSATSPGGTEMMASAEQILRMLGAVR
ncbi:MAG: MlaD family protein [Rhodococcus sp. (in: high G+C Gram-positive bacteria)]|uniref:MlaD family protein n=1 Tax=Rhodococcus sp. TaxID=1831 RepID=UPI003BAF7DE0